MPRPRSIRKRARKDANHNEIVSALESAGATWLDTSHIGGALDGVVGYAGIDQRCEVKNPNAERGRNTALKLTKEEQDTFDEWRGRKPVVLTSIEDVIQLLKQLRKESCSHELPLE